MLHFKPLALFFVAICSLNADTLLFGQAYDLAILNSNDVKSSNYTYLSNKEQINQSESKLYPQIDISGYYRKAEYKSGFDGKMTRQGLLNSTLSLNQVIYNHSIYAGVDLQKIRTQYFKIDHELKKQQLAADLFDTYLNILKSKNKIKYLEVYMQYQNSYIDMLQKKLKNHLASTMDLLQVKVKYNSSKIDLKKEEQLLDVYKNQLKQYIGNVAYDLPLIDIDYDITSVLNSMQNSIKVKKDSLEVIKSKINVDASSKNLEDAYSGYWPVASFQASYSRYTTDTPTIDAPYEYTDTAMFTIKMPIYSGGYTNSKVESSKLDLQAATEDYENVKKKKTVEYEQNLALFNASKDSVQMYYDAYNSAYKYVKSVEAGYKYGLKSIIDVDDARKDLYNVKYNYIDNLYQLIGSYIKLLLINNNFDGIEILDEVIVKKG